MSPRDRYSRRSFFAFHGGRALAALAASSVAASGSHLLISRLLGESDLLPGAEAQPPAPKKHALLIAVTQYEAGPMNAPIPLLFPEADAAAMANALRPSGYTTELLLGRQAKQKNILDALNGLKEKGNEQGIVLVGLFGHGVEYEIRGNIFESYFCPYDVSMRDRFEDGEPVPDRNGKTRIEPDPDRCVSMTQVFLSLKTSKAGRRALITDCCRNDPNIARGRAFGANITTADLADKTAALFACSSGQKAFEDPMAGHGVFTKAVLDVINTHKGPKPLTLSGLGETISPVVEKWVRQTNGKLQTPYPISSGLVDLMIDPLGVPQPPRPNPPQNPVATPPVSFRRGQVLTVRSVIGPGILSTSDDGVTPAGKSMVLHAGESVVVVEDATPRGIHIANLTSNGPGTRRGWLTFHAVTEYLRLPDGQGRPTEIKVVDDGGSAAVGTPTAKVLLTCKGQPLVARAIAIYAVANSRLEKLDERPTGNNGTLTLPFKDAKTGMEFLAVFAGDAEHGPSEAKIVIQ